MRKLFTVFAALTFVLQTTLAFADTRYIETDQVVIGKKTSVNPSLTFRGLPNGIRVNSSTGLIEYSNDNTNFLQVGSGGGGGVGTELLPNADFELGGVTSGWTATGLTAANVTSGTNLIDKKFSASLTATAVGQTFKSAALAIQGLAGGSCAASLRYLYTGNAGDWVLTAYNGTATVGSLALPASTSANAPQTVIFPCGTASTSTLQFILTSAVAAPGVLYFDNAHLGAVQLYQGLVNGQPTVIKQFLTSGTYTPSAGVTQIEVYMVGGGGGGGASGTSAGGAAGAGGSTTFGTLLTAGGGGAGGINGGGGFGGLPTVSSPAVSLITANGGGGMSVTSAGTGSSGGGAGGQSLLGGGPASSAGTGNQAVLAPPPQPNSGSGGSGAQWNGGTGFGGSGGGAGAFIDAIIPAGSIGASYAISIGSGGIGASAGASGAAGAAGAAGQVIIRETFQTVTQQAFLPSSGGLAAGDLVGTFGAQCPTGTILADGSAVSRAQYPQLFQAMGVLYGAGDGSTTFNLPNGQAAFLRGAGSQTFGGIAYSATQGTTQGDMLQGHLHSAYTTNSTAGASTYPQVAGLTSTGSAPTSGPISDGTNGPPRVGLETRPFNISLKYCVRVGAASAAPILVGGVSAPDSQTGAAVINTSQTFTASATLSPNIETAFGNTTTAAFTLTLPDATLNKSKKFIIKKTDSSANILTVQAFGAQTIDGIAAYKLGTQFDNFTIQSDGANWQTIQNNVSVLSAYGLTNVQNVAAQANIKYDTKIRDNLAMFSTSTGLWTLPYTGEYRITGAFYNNTGTVNMYVKVGGTSVGYVSISASANIYNGSISFYGIAGQTVGLYNDGGAANFTQPGTGGFVNSASLEKTGN